MNPATKKKRTELSRFIQQEVVTETSVQGVVVIGSVAKGIARADSDIDAIVFSNHLIYTPSQLSLSGGPMMVLFTAFLVRWKIQSNLTLNVLTYKSGQNQRTCGQNQYVLS